MSEPFIAEVRMFGGNFAPRGWAFCNGQLLALSQNTALFALIGTFYGGNGQTTFGLPDLQGRAPIHAGQGPGLTDRSIGEKAGAESVTLTTSQMPAHTHQLKATAAATTGTPSNAVALAPTSGARIYGPATNLAAMGASVSASGGQPHENRQPYLALNFIIALQGTFPSRN